MDALKPGVPKRVLFRLAGLLWSAVGLGLCALAASWLRPLPWGRAAAHAALGLALAGVMHFWIFRRVARKNIDRLGGLPDVPCLFAFQSAWSYLLVALMMGLGYALRHSRLPKPELAVAYLMMGGALLAGSFQYHMLGGRPNACAASSSR